MFKQDIANKKQQIKQLENLINQENNSFLLNNYKEALELRKNELKQLEKMQREYDLGIFDIYEYKYQEALRGFTLYVNSQRWSQTQKDDFLEKSMKQWEQENIELKYKSLRRNLLLHIYHATPPPSSKTQSTQKVLKSIESLQSFLKQATI